MKTSRNFVVTEPGLIALQQAQLTKNQLALLLFLAQQISPAGETVAMTELSAHLKTALPNISAALSKLIEHKLISRGPKEGRSCYLKFNPVYFRFL